MNTRIAENPLFQRGESGIDAYIHIIALFQNSKRPRNEPSTGMSGRKSLLTMPVAIGRIGKQQVERLDIVDAAEFGGIAPQYARPAMKAESIDIFPEQATALDAILYKQRHTTAAGQSLQPHGARSGKQIENPGSVEAVRIGVAQDIEQALACPVYRRTNGI